MGGHVIYNRELQFPVGLQSSLCIIVCVYMYILPAVLYMYGIDVDRNKRKLPLPIVTPGVRIRLVAPSDGLCRENVAKCL